MRARSPNRREFNSLGTSARGFLFSPLHRVTIHFSALRITAQQVDYRALAEFRYEVRRFQNLSEQAARAAGIEPQQYQALLAIKGLPVSADATIGLLAERLQIQHHSAVELADRLEAHGLLKRVRGRRDRRQVLLRLTRRAEEILRQVALPHRADLRSSGLTMLRALQTVMAHASARAVSRHHRQNSKASREV